MQRVLFRAGLRAFGFLHRLVYRASGGRIGGRIWGLPILLLTTTGRKTRKTRTAPLCFIRDDQDLVVVASNGGMDRHPSWWLNLERNPQASVQVGRTRRHVTARRASPAERARLWAEITGRAPGYLRYEARTEREIPVVILHPTG